MSSFVKLILSIVGPFSLQSRGQGISDGLSKFLMDNQVDSVSIKVDMLRDDAAQTFPALTTNGYPERYLDGLAQVLHSVEEGESFDEMYAKCAQQAA